MAINQHTMAVAKFKAECLREIEQVQQTGEPLIVTKRGKPIVKIIPILEENNEKHFGCLKDSLTIVGDITLPIDEIWDAEEGNI
ncbi:MAG: type II toxin-antitoxin system Phd/YefM family antitoxin [Gammaproteobacteria bacterium]